MTFTSSCSRYVFNRSATARLISFSRLPSTPTLPGSVPPCPASTAPRHTNTPIFHRHDHHGEQAYAENRLYHFLLHALFPRKSALHNTLFHGKPVYVRIFLSPFNPTQVLDSGFRSYRHHQLNPHISLSVFRFFHTLSCIDTSICHLYNRVRQHERSGF